MPATSEPRGSSINRSRDASWLTVLAGRSRVCLRFRSPLGGCRQSPEEPPGFGKQIPAVTPPCAVRRSAKLHDGLTSRQGSVGRPSALPRHQLLRPVGKRVLQPPRAESAPRHSETSERDTCSVLRTATQPLKGGAPLRGFVPNWAIRWARKLEASSCAGWAELG